MKTLLKRVYDAYLSVSATSFGRVTKHVDECPHCQNRTTWTVRILTGYARCQQCGRNPLNHEDRPPMPPNHRDPAAAPSGTA